MESSELPKNERNSPAVEHHGFVENLIVTKYGGPENRMISQNEAREDALEYISSELGWLVVAPLHTKSDDEETQARHAEDMQAIIEALEAKSQGDWSAIKYYLQDRSHLIRGASKTEAFPERSIPDFPEENPKRGDAFVRIANLI